MRRGNEQLAAFAEHGPEIRLRRLRSQPEEGQARGFQDHPADGGGHRDDDDGHDVRQDLGPDDAQAAHAGQPGRVDEFAMGDGHRRAPDVSGEEGNVDDGHRVEGVEQSRPQHRDDGQREQDVGKRHQQVDAAHHEVVRPSAEITGDDADGGADHRGQQRGGDPHRQTQPRAPDQAGEEIAAEVVGAENRAVGERRLQPIGGTREIRVGEGQHRREEGEGEDGEQHHPAEGGEPVAQDQAQGDDGYALRSGCAGRASTGPDPRGG